ncbi:MAG: hypothetical protein CMF67_07170 [Magnetovibrio sp.]|nr:hypothetical protein [Magnetovibrio sp.]
MRPSKITSAIKELGLRTGDCVFVHSDLSKMGFRRNDDGMVALALSAEELYCALRAAVSEQGTIAAPTFSYSWPDNDYDLNQTPSALGQFSEFVRCEPGSRRSNHPLLSVSANGPLADEICKNASGRSFGVGSPYEVLVDHDAVMLMVGVPFCSLKDHAETMFGVPYRYEKFFSYSTRTPCQSGKKYSHFVRYLVKQDDLKLVPFLDRVLPHAKSYITSTRFGAGQIAAIRAGACVKVTEECLREDPFFFLESTPHDGQAYTFLSGLIDYQSDGGLSIRATIRDEDGEGSWCWEGEDETLQSFRYEFPETTETVSAFLDHAGQVAADFNGVLNDDSAHHFLEALSALSKSKNTPSDFYSDGLMDLSSYRLEKAKSDDDWNAFINSSEQGTIFSCSEFLQSLDVKTEQWFCYKNNHLRGAAALILSNDGGSVVEHQLVIHNGIMLAPRNPMQNQAQALSEDFRTICFFVKELSARYESVHMALHWTFPDIRPFVWHNYSTNLPNYEIDVLYTSLLELEAMDSSLDPADCPMYKKLNKSRRQEIRYGISKGVYTEHSEDFGMFGRFYAKTFARQGKAPDYQIHDLIFFLKRLYEMGRLRMFVSRTQAGEPGSIAVFGVDNKGATYLFGANDPQYRASHMGTLVLWDSFRELAREGFRRINLEGVNSPARGYFKLSFGGSLTPYYSVSLSSEPTGVPRLRRDRQGEIR